MSKIVSHYASSYLIEVEIDSLKQLESALRANVDAVLLDNFSPEEIKEAVVCWLSRCRSTTETTSIASFIHNDPNAEVTLCEENIIINFSEPEDKKVKSLLLISP